MYLNDAFDQEIDARERPERPIPSGAVSARTVFGAGFACWRPAGCCWAAATRTAGGGHRLARAAGRPAACRGDRALRCLAQGQPAEPGGHGRLPDAGLCRCRARRRVLRCPPMLIAALVALSYLIGLTYAAKQETLARSRISGRWAFSRCRGLRAVGRRFTGLAGLIAAAAFLGWLGYALSFLVRRRHRRSPRRGLADRRHLPARRGLRRRRRPRAGWRSSPSPPSSSPSPCSAASPEPETMDDAAPCRDLLRGWLARRIAADALAWLDEAAAKIAEGEPPIVTSISRSPGPRKVGKADLALERTPTWPPPNRPGPAGGPATGAPTRPPGCWCLSVGDAASAWPWSSSCASPPMWPS
jgi:hypothetical protein